MLAATATFFQKIASQYTRQLVSNPLRTNIATGGVLAFTSDLICQTVVEKVESVAWKRTAAIAIFGMYYNGGICTLVYPLYSRVLPHWFASSPLRQGVGSTLVDNFIHSPIFYVPSFYMSTAILQGIDFNTALTTLKRGYITTMLSTWLIWIPLQTFNFSVVPTKLRVLVLSVGCFFYTIQLDHLQQNFANREEETVHENVPDFRNASSET
jgi:protein Mpv17|tara:strand:+ start:77 stop:709 length:633 start_codon:yes stop_codon:yes gene_type:complete